MDTKWKMPDLCIVRISKHIRDPLHWGGKWWQISLKSVNFE